MLSCFSSVQFFVTLMDQAPLSVRFSRQEYQSGLPCPPSGDLPDSGIRPASLTSPALADRFFITSATWEAPIKLVERLKDKSSKILYINNTSLRDTQYKTMGSRAPKTFIVVGRE